MQILINLAHIEAIKPKSVNLALETVLEFNHKNNAADMLFLDNVQQFLDKVKTVIGTNRTARRFDTEAKNIKFTDFVKTAIEILKTYDDDDLEDVFAVFDDEIRKYHYRGCKFYELVEDQNVRRFVANKLDEVKNKNAGNIKKYLDNAIQAIEDSKFSSVQTEFLDYVNSLYGQDSNEKFKSFLNNLQTYSRKSKRANLDLIKVVRDGIRTVIFDHYSSLNANARRDLKIKLETSWRSVKYPQRVEHNVWTINYTSKNFKTDTYNEINDHTEDKKPKRTTRTVKRYVDSELSDSDEEFTTTHKQKSNHNKHRYLKEVYFNTDIYNKMNSDDYFKSKTTQSEKVISDTESDSRYDDLIKESTDPVKLRSLNTVTVDSEFSNNEEEPTTHYKHKSKTTKHIKKSRENTKPKYITPKKYKSTHKRLSSFITLYPEEITFNTEKLFQKEPTTRRARLYTLWEEIFLQKKQKKLKSSKSKSNFRKGPKMIAESDTVINVKRARESNERDVSSVESSSHEHKRRDSNINSETKSTTKYHVYTKTTKSKYKPTTHKKYRKYIPKATTLEEGISIESSEIKRRSMIEKNNTNTGTVLKQNVLKRINNLEKEMQEVKSKIDTKLTTDENTKDTEFELEFWKSTTVNNTKSISNNTLSTKSFENNVTSVTTEINTALRRDFNKTKTEDNVKIDNITNIHKQKIESTTDNVVSKNVSDIEDIKALASLDASNYIGKDLESDNLIQKIAQKYNISVKPEEVEKHFDYDKLLEHSTKPGDRKKNEEVKDIIENDLKKILGDNIKSNDANELNDPFQDLNSALDFIRR